MLRRSLICLLSVGITVGALSGCEEKKTRKITIEGPDKKTEIKMETKEKKKDK
ncbi:MAG: hypothetical protein AABZ08_07015 [Planctomycetota bacterium]